MHSEASSWTSPTPDLSRAAAPLTVGPVTLRNRLVATAHASGLVHDGLPLHGDAEYWGRLAAGGAALLICGGTVVAPESAPRRGNILEVWRPEAVPALRRRVRAIHAEGAVAVCQLVHLGRETLGAETYHAPIAPSAVRSPREPTAPRAMLEREIDAMVDAFHASASNALEAGFDGIELHAAHAYLLEQFLSPRTNTRGDGRDVLGRVIAAIRGLSPSALLGIRFSVDAAEDVALTRDELAELLPAVDPLVDYVNLTVGVRTTYVRDMATERPPLLEELPRLRPLVSRPLLVSQAFRDPAAIAAALEVGADLVGMARGLIADPELPRKLLAGRSETVRPCVACNEDCRSFDPILLCTVNPELAPPGHPARPAAPLLVGARPTAPVRRVAVVGAGPAGLECAVALAGEGREVVLWERGTGIGGSMALAGSAPHRPGWLRMLPFYRAGLESAGAELRLGSEPTPAELEDFEAIVIATGAAEVLPSYAAPGFARTASEAIGGGERGLAGASHLVVVDDGFGWWPSVNAVELGVAAGVHGITVVTPGTAFAHGIPPESRVQLMPRLRSIKLSMRPLTSLVGAADGAVELRHASGAVDRLEADAVIVVSERRPHDWAGLADHAGCVIAIGDAVVPRRVAHAIAEGRATARAIAGKGNRASSILALRAHRR
jgi:2,4-dienoyl-CoA reductase-like NADH-dependent reductase (Old Yellow Enzyme family)